MAKLSFEDFRTNGVIDWKAYTTAEINNGERCYQCRGMIFSLSMEPSGYQTLCTDCKRLRDDKDEVSSRNYYRCPKCRERLTIDDQYYLYSEGSHEVICFECEHEFTIETFVEITFRSPAVLEGEAIEV